MPMNTEVKFTYRRNTDIAHVDVVEPPPQAEVAVKEIGDEVGFPGLVLVRFDANTGQLYGMTFQRWSKIKRTLMWRNRTVRVRRAINDLVNKIVEFCGNETSRRRHRLALSH